MLRFRLLHSLPYAVVWLLLSTPQVSAAEITPVAARVPSLKTEELVQLVDETEFNDPFAENHRLAIRALIELLGRDLTDEQETVAHYRLAVYHLRLGEREAAMEEVTAALRSDPENAEYLLMKGSLLFDAGKSTEGTAFARRALIADSDFLDAQQSYSRLTSRAHVAEDDRVLLKKSEPLLPMIAHPYLKCATAYFKSEDYRSALTRIENYLRLNPFDFQHRDDAYMVLAVSSSKLPAAEGAPRVAETELVRRAILAWNMTTNRPHRLEIFKTLIRSVHVSNAGKSPGTVLALSESLVNEGGLQDRALSATRYVRAKAYAALGRYAEAIAEVDRSLRVEPDNVDTRAMKVEYLTWMGQYAAALKEGDAILKKNPNHVSTLLLKAQIHAGCPDKKFRDPQAAVKLASHACNAAQQTKRPQLFNPYKMLVLASAEAGDYESAGAAVKHMRQAAGSVEDVKEVEQLSDHVRAQKPWTIEHPADNGRLPRHKLLYQQLMLSQPNLQLPELQAHYEKLCDELLAAKELTETERTSCLRRRALCRVSQGKFDPAVADIKEVLGRTPKDYSMLVLLNRAHLRKNDVAAATALVDQFAKLGDSSKESRFAGDMMHVERGLHQLEHATFATPQERDGLAKQTGERIDRLIREAPQQPVLYQFRALNKFHCGEYAAALEDNQRCLDSSPYRPRDEYASAIALRARILDKLYRFDSALEYAAMAIHVEGPTERNRQLVVDLYRSAGKGQLAAFWGKDVSPGKIQPAVAETRTTTAH